LTETPRSPKDFRHEVLGEPSGWQEEWDDELASSKAVFEGRLNQCAGYSTWNDLPMSEASERLPITCVTWFEAFAFCAWDGGRLPTEAEWNLAAAGTGACPYPWASCVNIDISLSNYNCEGDESPAGECAVADILPVGSRAPDDEAVSGGASDLIGNLMEWNLDFYSGTYDMPCTDCTHLEDEGNRVVRGGSYLHGPYNNSETLLLSGTRVNVAPSVHQENLGFRCTCTARDPQAGLRADNDGLSPEFSRKPARYG
jgi:formylglycine-generating enzyme